MMSDTGLYLLACLPLLLFFMIDVRPRRKLPPKSPQLSHVGIRMTVERTTSRGGGEWWHWQAAYVDADGRAVGYRCIGPETPSWDYSLSGTKRSHPAAVLAAREAAGRMRLEITRVQADAITRHEERVW